MERSEVFLKSELERVIDTCNSRQRSLFSTALADLLDICSALGIPTESSKNALAESPASIDRPFDSERMMLACFAEIGAGFMVSRSPVGHCVATVFHPEFFDETSFQSEDLAFAMLGAVATALIGALENPNN